MDTSWEGVLRNVYVRWVLDLTRSSPQTTKVIDNMEQTGSVQGRDMDSGCLQAIIRLGRSCRIVEWFVYPLHPPLYESRAEVGGKSRDAWQIRVREEEEE